MEPTEKQLAFIRKICVVLELDDPHCETKESARTWISEHAIDYKYRYAEIRALFQGDY